jgi:hypothetical protein
MYSKLLYMKTRVTFRVDSRLATALREVPNQTRFVEKALKDALGKTCPVCRGSGRLAVDSLHVSDFRSAALPKLERAAATLLKELVRFGKRMQATDLRLEAKRGEEDLEFHIARDDEILLRGRLNPTGGALYLN